MDKQKQRKPTTSKLKRILQCKSNVSPLPSLDKDLGHTIEKAPPPSLQHSSNMHSLASPTHSSIELDHRSSRKTPRFAPTTQQPQVSSTSTTTRSTSACAMKKSFSSNTRVRPTVVTGTTTPHGRRSSSLYYNKNQMGLDTSIPSPLPSMAPKTMYTDGSITPHCKTTSPTKNDNCSKGRRRHSCSSSTQDQQRNQRFRMCQEAKKTPPPPPLNTKISSPSPFNAVTPSCSVLFSKASPAANAALAASSSPSSLIPQSSSRRQCPPPILSMEKSRSTPLRSHTKVKTYNVSPTTPTIKSPTNIPQRSTSSSLSSPNKKRSQRPDGTTLRVERDSERKRRQQELEDLISGRRGSTLKLSLTPKSILLN